MIEQAPSRSRVARVVGTVIAGILLVVGLTELLAAVANLYNIDEQPYWRLAAMAIGGVVALAASLIVLRWTNKNVGLSGAIGDHLSDLQSNGR